MKSIHFFTILIILFAVTPPVQSQDPSSWQSAVEKFTEKRNSANNQLRLKLLQNAVKAMYPGADAEAVNVFSDCINGEVARGKDTSDQEDAIKYEVLTTAMAGLKKITRPKAIGALCKNALDEKTFWRARFYIIRALAAFKDNADVAKTLVKLVDSTNTAIKLSALYALSALKLPSARPAACNLLTQDITWEVKVAAVKYLETLDDKELVKPLIDVLCNGILDGYVRFKIVELLKKLTGVDCGFSGKPWQDWWAKKQQAKNPDLAPPKGATSLIPIKYYGITATATRLIFILDLSGSMQFPSNYEEDKDNPERAISTAPPLPDEYSGEKVNESNVNKLIVLKKESDARIVRSRFDGAQKQLVDTIFALDPSVEFAIVFFSTAPRTWQDTMLKATMENKISAISYIMDKIGPRGGTSFYDALECAFKFTSAGQEPAPANAADRELATEHAQSKSPHAESANQRKEIKFNSKCNYIKEFGGADNIFIVTDGAPTLGKIIDKDEIIQEIRKVMEIRGITINTVAIGDEPLNPNALDPTLDVDVKFLEKIAEVTGGVFKDHTSKLKNKLPPKNK